MIVYRHQTEVIPPDLAEWEHRDSTVARVSQRSGDFQYVGIADPVFWEIPPGKFSRLEDGWEAALVRDKGSVVPSRDLARVKCWAPILTVEDARGEQWLAPVILTPEGHRAYSVNYSGPDFLPDPTPEQQRAETIAKEARAALEKSLGGGEGVSTSIACRWAAVLLSVTTHLSANAVAALGVLDDALVRRILIVASGLDRRLDAG